MTPTMKFFVTIFLMLSMVSFNGLSYELKNVGHDALTTVNVIDFGAVGDGNADDSEAFMNAWKTVCGLQGSYVNFIIASGKKFLVKPMLFQGPCNSSQLHIQILGTMTTSKSKYNWGSVDCWLVFRNIDGLTVSGNGILDGNGSPWWQDYYRSHGSNGAVGMKNYFPQQLWKTLTMQDSVFSISLAAKGVYAGNQGPDALKFFNCKFLNLDHLNIINSPKRHLVLYGVSHANVSNINIASPGDSPNTDGILIGLSTFIELHYASIQSGDDCIAILTGSANINISNIACGPGHGISIGSLGGKGTISKVEQVFVRDCTLTNTQNGLRIKTWQGGAGYATKILYDGVKMNNVSNPIIIDQNYCPHDVCSSNENSAVQVSDITYNRVSGTTNSKYAIDLSCNRQVACTNLILHDIDLRPTLSGQSVSSSCVNAHGRVSQSNPPVNCLLG